MDEHVGQVPPDLEPSGRMKNEAGAGGEIDPRRLLDGQAIVDEESHLQQRQCEHEHRWRRAGVLEQREVFCRGILTIDLKSWHL